MSPLEQLMDQVEQQLLVVRSALLGDDPTVLESSTQTLQLQVAELFKHHEQYKKSGQSTKHLNLRMKELSAAITLVRENILRKSAFVDQALQIMFPDNAPSTYAHKSGPYGSAMRKSGKFGGYSA